MTLSRLVTPDKAKFLATTYSLPPLLFDFHCSSKGSIAGMRCLSSSPQPAVRTSGAKYHNRTFACPTHATPSLNRRTQYQHQHHPPTTHARRAPTPSRTYTRPRSRTRPAHTTHSSHVSRSRVGVARARPSGRSLTKACSRTDWAEEEDENDLALPQQTVTKNKDGTETIVSYRINEDGKKVKTTRRIKKTVIKQVVNPRVAERKSWAKFGQEKGKAAGPQTDTVSVAENIVFRPQSNWKAAQDDKGDEDKKKLELKNAKIKCRICSGDHFTTKCPFKDTMAPEGADAPADMPDDAPGGAGGLGVGSGGYVPPHMRGKVGGGEKMGGKFDRDDSATLRVTNVSEFAEEQDLRDMFSRYGHVTRVFLAKDRETGRAKGFAFISYADRSDAAKACEKMDGCKWFHRVCGDWGVLLIRCSWFPSPYSARRIRQEGLSVLVTLRVACRYLLRLCPGHSSYLKLGGRKVERVFKSHLGALRRAFSLEAFGVCTDGSSSSYTACCLITACFLNRAVKGMTRE
jgi:translation initiation factor 3 subunit G